MSSRLVLGGTAAVAATYFLYRRNQNVNGRNSSYVYNPPAQSGAGEGMTADIHNTAGFIGGGRGENNKNVVTTNGRVVGPDYIRGNITDDTSRLIKDRHFKANNNNTARRDYMQQYDKTLSLSQDHDLARTSWERITQGLVDDYFALQNAILHKKKEVPSPTSSVKDTTQSIFNWGFDEAERMKAIALGEYDKANRTYNDILNKLNNVQSKTSNEAKTLSYQLESAKNTLEEKKTALQHHHQNDGSSKEPESFLQWIKRRNNELPTDVDYIASKSVHGWGENAEEFGREELQDNLDLKKNNSKSKSHLVHELKKSWGNTKEDAEHAKNESLDQLNEALENAKENYYSVKSKLDANTKHWWNFTKEKNDQLMDQLNENYNKAKREYDEATENLQAYKDKYSEEFWNKSDQTLSQTKKMVNKTHNAVMGGLDSTQDYVKNKKN